MRNSAKTRSPQDAALIRLAAHRAIETLEHRRLLSANLDLGTPWADDHGPTEPGVDMPLAHLPRELARNIHSVRDDGALVDATGEAFHFDPAPAMVPQLVEGAGGIPGPHHHLGGGERAEIVLVARAADERDEWRPSHMRPGTVAPIRSSARVSCWRK